MIGVGKVISTSHDASGRLVVKILYQGKLIEGKGDVRTPIESSAFGIDSNPTDGKVPIYAASPVKGKYYVIGYLNTNRLAETGEVRLFSTDADGELQAYVWLRNNGQFLELNGDDNFAVKFNELKEEFNKLKADYNSLVSVFNAHVHVVANAVPLVPGPVTAAPSATQGTPNTSNIDLAKNDKIKTNS